MQIIEVPINKLKTPLKIAIKNRKSVAQKYINDTSAWVSPFCCNLWYKWDLCEIKIFSWFINLFIIVVPVSKINGEIKNIIESPIFNSGDLNIKKHKKEPINRLPVSPMKTFDGYQFQNKKPNNAPTKRKPEL